MLKKHARKRDETSSPVRKQVKRKSAVDVSATSVISVPLDVLEVVVRAELRDQAFELRFLSPPNSSNDILVPVLKAMDIQLPINRFTLIIDGQRYAAGTLFLSSVQFADEVKTVKVAMQQMEVTVTAPSGLSTVVRGLYPSSTIAELKTHICSLFCLPERYQRLSFAGKRLSNSTRTLLDYEIPHKGHVEIAAPSQTVIYFKTLTGKTIELPFVSGAAITEVKQWFQDKEGVPPDQYRLIFDGRQLDDTRCLCDYGIDDGDTLFLVMRLRGGMFHHSSGRMGGSVCECKRAKIVIHDGLCARTVHLCRMDSVETLLYMYHLTEGEYEHIDTSNVCVRTSINDLILVTRKQRDRTNLERLLDAGDVYPTTITFE